MKTIYLRVDMPDYFVIDKDIDLMDYANHYIEFTEIQLPSEKEIIQNEHLIIDEYENVSKDQKWFMGVGFRLCATWLLNKMKGK